MKGKLSGTQCVSIAGRPVGPTYPPYIVAEMSGNHNGDLQRAFRILDAAKESGADAVKIQTYRADTITIDHGGPGFVIEGGLWGGRRLFDLYEEAHTPWDWHKPIFEHARRIGITVFSSPFDSSAVDLLESLGAPAYKIASPELIDLPLIERVARTGKPLVLSTGMATSDEIAEAVTAARKVGATEIIVLHCTAAYPAPPEEANLATIAEIAGRFNVIAGLSDHTMGTFVPVIAVTRGADFIEKHFTLDRAEGGVDSVFSLEPAELTELVRTTRIARQTIGAPAFAPTASEATVLKSRRSLYVVAPIAKGEAFTSANLRSIRPGLGIKPKYLDAVIGRLAARDIAFGEPLDTSMIDGGFDGTVG
jgi:pseudaminic acid synthase